MWMGDLLIEKRKTSWFVIWKTKTKLFFVILKTNLFIVNQEISDVLGRFILHAKKRKTSWFVFEKQNWNSPFLNNFTDFSITCHLRMRNRMVHVVFLTVRRHHYMITVSLSLQSSLGLPICKDIRYKLDTLTFKVLTISQT